jgi:phosphopantothenate---cysteine ligase (CTP)
VRRLTNFSTGALGSALSNILVDHGHDVLLMLGYYATATGPLRAQKVERFTTTADLQSQLERHRSTAMGAVFHAAAVSDFAFGQVWRRTASGELQPATSGKYSTRQGALLAELVPTPKIIRRLRDWFPQARLVGWKYEVDGDRVAAVSAGEAQLRENHTDACVINGPAYGPGFGWLERDRDCRHLDSRPDLFLALAKYLQ